MKQKEEKVPCDVPACILHLFSLNSTFVLPMIILKDKAKGEARYFRLLPKHRKRRCFQQDIEFYTTSLNGFQSCGCFVSSVFQSRCGRRVSTVSKIVTVHIQLYICAAMPIDGREFLLLQMTSTGIAFKSICHTPLLIYCDAIVLATYFHQAKSVFLNAFVNVKKSQTRPERAFYIKKFTISETKQCFRALKLTYLMGGGLFPVPF